MPTPSARLPKYRHYKPKELAVVRINGHDHYLGKYGSEESREKYNRLIAEWLTIGQAKAPTPADPPATAPLVSEIILSFWKHAERYYRAPDGSPSLELENFRDALRPLKRLYGRTPAREFGPLALQAVRDEMIKAGLARTTINARINRIRRVFRWAASVQLIPGSVVEDLRTVEGLKCGRSEAREPEDVPPVPVEHVEAVLSLLPRPVAAMVQLQLLTGCRAGEVMSMRGCDLTPGDPAWEYRPATHKNEWRGRRRVIPLGPKAQEIVKEFLNPDLAAYLFSPADVVAEIHMNRRASRKSKPTPSELARCASEGAGRKHARKYDRRTYRQAILRACRKAGVPEWSPLQLRHTAATAIRARYGLETAQVVLGHAKADTTEIYAERDLARARAVMAEIG
jgi:integrase